MTPTGARSRDWTSLASLIAAFPTAPAFTSNPAATSSSRTSSAPISRAKQTGPGNFFGVYIDGIVGASNNTIGPNGSTTSSGNLISGNIFSGILIFDNGGSAQNNLVIGNKIGTDVSGFAAVPNTGDGIDLFGSNNTVGGTTAGTGNLISGNSDGSANGGGAWPRN